MNNAPLATITERVGDAWSSGSEIAHDLGASAAERASELASVAAERIPELPETVNRLAHRAQRRFRPAKGQPSWVPLLIVALVVFGAGVALVIWGMRRSRAKTEERAVSAVPDDYTERAAAAAVGK
jgi:hypothetical protein